MPLCLLVGLSQRVHAPAAPDREIVELVRFKMAKITPLGFGRVGVWTRPTVRQKLAHLGLMFGALTAEPQGSVEGAGVALDDLALGMLAFPRVWRWYVERRHRRRGFHTRWEAGMLQLAGSFLRPQTGWLRQSPHLALRPSPIPGLLSTDDIAKAQSNWSGLCDETFLQMGTWRKDITRIARVHRDPFQAVLPVLEADSPAGVYNRIPEEILRRLPDGEKHPLAAAEAIRAFLMLRIGLHTGLRQRNLRQLRVCPVTSPPTPMDRLEAIASGELHWDSAQAGWVVTIPANAFKNGGSSYFANSPYALRLPDYGGLYVQIIAYLTVHRPLLLAEAEDPGTFFVKTVRNSHLDRAHYEEAAFYTAWRRAIERYGVYNPYTGRGAVKGLLPHGPHNVRDVLATHILKRTGSYEHAGYAIQDTPEMVARHYARFLPHEKAAIAARILAEVWENA